MKKFQIVLIMGIICSVITTKTTAQPLVNNGKNQEENFASDDRDKDKTPDSKSEAKLNKASSKALSDFKSNFKKEPDVKWSVEQNAIVANFTKDAVKTTVIYDRKGRWVHTISSYQENKLPEDIRSLVKRSVYFDYNITLVQQIQEGDITFYIIHLENGKKYKQVSVYDGEINVLKEFDLQ